MSANEVADKIVLTGLCFVSVVFRLRRHTTK